MNNWSEYDIGVVYYTGIFISVLCNILIIFYLNPLDLVLKKITGKFNVLWKTTFKTTIILSALLGALSVSFKDCKGKYDYLLESKEITLTKGIEQVATSFDYLAIILGIWLLIFIILTLILKVKKKDI